jgi:hypothetical protein
MRRRLATLLSAATLSTALLLPATALPAIAEAPAADTVVLAASGPGSTAGLDPMEPDDEANEFAPATYEANWTWRAGKVLLGAFLLLGLYIGLMYYLRVVRPAQRSEQS